MVWNKTDQKIVNKILKELEVISKSYSQIAQDLEVSEWIVGATARKFLPKELKKLRYRYSCSKGKLGVKNPMYKRTGIKHHNSKELVRVAGYKTVFKPDWWQGTLVKSGRIYEHHYIWAKENGKTSFPKGFVIHHKDENKDNNSIGNLQLLTISEHIKLHSKIRKEQRLGRNPVESSTLEAHDNLIG